MEILVTVGYIVTCVLLFSLAIAIHEFGHFIVALKLGLRVERFSIGFGPALWKKKVGEVEYRISAIPLGGYVSIPDIDPEGTKKLEGCRDQVKVKGEGEQRMVSPSQAGKNSAAEKNAAVHLSPSPSPRAPIAPWKEIAVAFAGPAMNLVLAAVLAVLLALVPSAKFGELPAVLGGVIPDGAAEKAGLKVGDRILSVGGRAVNTWTEMQTEVQITGGKPTEFVVERGAPVDAASSPRQTVDAESLPRQTVDAESLPRQTVDAESLPRQNKDDSSSEDAVSHRVYGRGEGAASTGTRTDFASTGARTDFASTETVTLVVTPEKNATTGAYYIMAYSMTNSTGAVAWMPARNPLKQLAWDAGSIFRVLKGLVTPKEAKATAGALGGPVMIAEGIYRSLRHNAWDGVGFLRFLNVNLAVLNLLPLPVLDGGLIFFAFLALVFRRRVPEKVVTSLSMAFMYLLFGLMGVLILKDSWRSWKIHTYVAPVDAKSVRVPVDAKSVRVEKEKSSSASDAEGIPRLREKTQTDGK